MSFSSFTPITRVRWEESLGFGGGKCVATSSDFEAGEFPFVCTCLSPAN